MEWSSFSIGNAAGFIKGPGKEFDDMLRSAATDITIGSITREPRAGNSGNVYHYFFDDGTSINSLGLPNPGLESIAESAPDMAKRAFTAGKKLRFSVAGFEPGEYSLTATMLSRFGKVEVNLGCPNVWGDEGQKMIASFNMDLIEETLFSLRHISHGVDVKLSPYSNPMDIPKVASVLRRHNVSNVVTSNTFPNGLAFRDNSVLLGVPGGYGGVGGGAMNLIALGQVAQFATALQGSRIGVIGVGGISLDKHVVAMRKAGAIGVQIGTEFGEYGARVFSDILEDLVK